jgi:hypothetical protein
MIIRFVNIIYFYKKYLAAHFFKNKYFTKNFVVYLYKYMLSFFKSILYSY